jgi:hypothetical protein
LPEPGLVPPLPSDRASGADNPDQSALFELPEVASTTEAEPAPPAWRAFSADADLSDLPVIPREPVHVTLRESVTGQRRTVQVGSLLIVAAIVVGAAVGYPLVGLFLAIGVALAIVNSIFTEHGMARMVASGEELSRKQFAYTALMRLAAISLVGFGLVVLFWRQGAVAVLFGLALFQMMTLMLQGIPLLKELHKV